MPVKTGVLALQGAFARHAEVLRACGAHPIEVRTPDELTDIDALVLPGGESTTMSMMLERNELFEPLRARLEAGLPAFGTCAGLILLSAHVLDGREDQRSFGVIDLDVRRNAYGRQIDSFEADLSVDALGSERFPAVFIRAPAVERVGEEVEVLAVLDDRPVLARQGGVLVAAFHPELSDDARLHQLFLDSVESAKFKR